MKIIVTIFLIFNNLVWLITSLGSLNNFLRGIIPPPTKPSVGLVVIMFVMFLMNLLTLFYILRKTDDVVNPKRKANMKNFFIGLGWFVVIYFSLTFFTGMVLGAIAGGATATPAQGAEAGRQASVNFFHKYGLVYFLGSILTAIAGTITGWLPFTKEEAS